MKVMMKLKNAGTDSKEVRVKIDSVAGEIDRIVGRMNYI